jgi:asparagine synthase (glutamine-hydrolysing)
MCGIAVAIDWDEAEATVGRMLGGILHRGDVSDPLVSPRPKTAMATRRLRIVDGSHAAQPQPSFNGRFLVSFNGEIYNHAELRGELEAEGVRFKTASDTEVLASGLAFWGRDLLKRINGMYAFVALDVETGDFIAARDPMGVKPLYLMQSGEGFLFCSEIRPLLSAVENEAVLLLPAGHLLTRTEIVPFESRIGEAARTIVSHGAETLDRLLAHAVHSRIPADLACATTFSGGIDSTLVTHYARQLRPEMPGYFLGGATAPDYEYASRYADMTGLDLRLVGFDDGANDPLARIGAVVGCLESFEPGEVRNGVCGYLLAQRMHADGYRVALTGEGADELFAGYAPLALAFSDSDDAGAFLRDQCVGLMHRTCLQRLDRTSMRFEVEAREPFLDPAVIAYALTLHGNELVDSIGGGPRGKVALRELWSLYPDQLPTAIRDRRKTAMNEGTGFDQSPTKSPWISLAEETFSEADFADGRRRYEVFDIRSKEELLYLEKLAESMDVWRVPHLRARTRLVFPALRSARPTSEFLQDYLVGA